MQKNSQLHLKLETETMDKIRKAIAKIKLDSGLEMSQPTYIRMAIDRFSTLVIAEKINMGLIVK